MGVRGVCGPEPVLAMPAMVVIEGTGLMARRFKLVGLGRSELGGRCTDALGAYVVGNAHGIDAMEATESLEGAEGKEKAFGLRGPGRGSACAGSCPAPRDGILITYGEGVVGVLPLVWRDLSDRLMLSGGSWIPVSLLRSMAKHCAIR